MRWSYLHLSLRRNDPYQVLRVRTRKSMPILSRITSGSPKMSIYAVICILAQGQGSVNPCPSLVSFFTRSYKLCNSLADLTVLLVGAASIGAVHTKKLLPTERHPNPAAAVYLPAIAGKEFFFFHAHTSKRQKPPGKSSVLSAAAKATLRPSKSLPPGTLQFVSPWFT